MGPVGLLVGLASAGIGMGVMQIPEEHRSNVCNRAASSLEKARDMAWDLSDGVSTRCGKFYGQEIGKDPSNVMGKVVQQDIVDRCCSGADDKRRCGEDGHSLAGTEAAAGAEIRSQGSSPVASAMNGAGYGAKGFVGDVFGEEHPNPSQLVGEKRDAMASDNDDVGRRVACGRKGETFLVLESFNSRKWVKFKRLHCEKRISPLSHILHPQNLFSPRAFRTCCAAESNSLAKAIITAESVARCHGERTHHSRR